MQLARPLRARKSRPGRMGIAKSWTSQLPSCASARCKLLRRAFSLRAKPRLVFLQRPRKTLPSSTA
eukprot:2422229-Alexandrium_andersonii.AAC.1